MIKLYAPDGRVVYLSPQAIAWIKEAGVSSQWHGIRCYVKCQDGELIECTQTAEEVNAAIAEGGMK